MTWKVCFTTGRSTEALPISDELRKIGFPGKHANSDSPSDTITLMSTSSFEELLVRDPSLCHFRETPLPTSRRSIALADRG